MRFFSKFDKFLLFLAIGIFLFAGYLLWDDSILFGGSDSTAGLTAVGEVRLTKNDVRRKSKRNFSWSGLDTNSRLFSGDSLFTGKFSELQLKLDDGTEMTISENTLIVLEKSSTALNLDLKYGEVDRIETQTKIVLNQGGEKSEFTGTQNSVLSIKSKEGKAVLKVLAGEVKVKSKAGEQKIVAASKNDNIQLDKPKPVIKAPKLLSPFNNAIYLLESKKLLGEDGQFKISDLEFKWQNISENAPGSVFFQVARDKEFKDVVFKKELTESQIALKDKDVPREGKYFWRVGAMSDVGRQAMYSTPHLVSLQKDPQLALTYPPNQAKFWINKNKPAQKFSWVGNSLSKSYEIEIGKDAEFKEVVLKQTVNADKFEWNNVPSLGKYYWRIKTALAAPPAQEFTLIENRNPVALLPAANTTLILKDFKVILPEEKMEIVDSKPKGTDFEFKWETGEFAESIIEFSTKSDFKDPKEIKFSIRVKEGPAKLKELPAGDFFWRVRGEDNRHSENLASAALPIKILADIVKTNVTAPELANAEKKIEMRPIAGRSPSSTGRWFKPYDLSGNGRPYLEWNSIGDKAKYNLVISKDQDGKNVVVKKEVNENKFDWQDMKPGNYFWFVSAAESTLTKEGSKAVGTLKVTVPSPAPQAVSLKKEKVLTDDQMKASGPKAKLSWSPSPMAANYRVEISKDKSFAKAKPFKSKETAAMHTVEGSGTYYWRVTALDKESNAISEPGIFSEFTFDRSLGLYPPVSANPKFDSSMVFLSKKASHLVLGWQKVEGATQYEYEVSLDPSFKTPYKKGKSKALKEYLEIELPAGKNFWRVRAINDKYQSEWSEPSPFLVSYGNN
jgi:hypothetical protein